MAPPIKPPEERFISYIKELSQDIELEDIANETWISKSIESVTRNLSTIDLELFKTLRTIHELVKFIRDESKIVEAIESLAIQMFNLEQSKRYQSTKSASLARRLLSEGRKLDASKRYNSALNKLNEAILISPFPVEGSDSGIDQIFSQILDARSNALFNQSRFLESIYDGDAAIKCNYPTEEIAKILKRRIICLKKTDREDDFQAELKSIQILRAMPTKDRLVCDLIRTADKLSQEGEGNAIEEDQSVQKIIASFMLMDFSGSNYYLPSAVRSITKEFDSRKGNLLRTKRAHELGCPILREEVFVSSIFPEYHKSRCNKCMCEIRDRFYPCPNCDVVRYCSTDCQISDWSSITGFHSHSCKHSMLFYGFSIFRLVHDIFVARREQQKCDDNRNWVDSYIHWICSFIFSDIHTNNYESFSSLASTFHEDWNMRFGFLLQSLLITKLLSIIHPSTSSDGEEDLFDLNIFVLRTMLTIECCKVRLPDYDLAQIALDGEPPEEEASLSKSIGRMKKITIKNYYGFGIFNTMALLNHSCDPNADYLTHGNQVYVFAKRDIKPGEEITISYGPKADEDTTEHRRQMLLSNFGFVCSCEKCLE